MASSQDKAGTDASGDAPQCFVAGASWCGYTQKFQAALDGGMSNDLTSMGMQPLQFLNCDKEDKQICDALSQKGMISGYPTLIRQDGQTKPGYTDNAKDVYDFCTGGK